MRKILCVYNEVPSGAASIHQRRKNKAGRSMTCQPCVMDPLTLLHQPHREFYALVPYCSFWNRSAAMRRFRASTPTCTAEVVSSLMS